MMFQTKEKSTESRAELFIKKMFKLPKQVVVVGTHSLFITGVAKVLGINGLKLENGAFVPIVIEYK